MSKVKSTPENDWVVVPAQPRRGFFQGLIALLVIALCILGSYYGGYFRAVSTTASAVSERDRLLISDRDKTRKIGELEQQVANLKLGSEVDRKATEQVRLQVVDLNNKISELERDNTFYRELMRPESDDKGISISDPLIAAVNDNTYEYKLVIKQLAADRKQVNGYMEVVLTGQLDGRPKRIPLKLLSEAIEEDRIKLNFRYFQRVEGHLVLPDTFTPEGIELKIVSIKPRKSLIEKQFNWLIKES